MSDYNTGNPVPSTDPRDLDDNATVLDLLLNGLEASYPDRRGTPRKSWKAVEEEAEVLIAPNVVALAGLALAANKGLYATGPGALAMFDLTPLARTFMGLGTTALQRTALELANAAQATVQNAFDDTTPTRLLTVGSFGWNGGDALPKGSAVNANALTVPGLYVFATGGVNLPETNCYIFVMKDVASGFVKQLAYGYTSNTFYSRTQNATVWTSWEAFTTSGSTLGVSADYIEGLVPVWNSASSITIKSGGAYIQSSSSTLRSTSDLTLSSLSLTASTWYYVYLYNNAGTPAIELSTTAPAAPFSGNARSKAGDTTRRYICSLRSNAGTGLWNFQWTPCGLTRYRETVANAPFRLLGGGTSAGFSTAAGAAVIPPTTTTCQVFVFNQSAAFFTLSASDGSAPILAIPPNMSATPIFNTNPAREFLWQAASGGAYIDVLAYGNER